LKKSDEKRQRPNAQWAEIWDKKYNNKETELAKLLKESGFLKKLKKDIESDYNQIIGQGKQGIINFLNK
jgi:hypothetical protein